MRKITKNNIHEIKIGNLIAKYPITGEIFNEEIIDEKTIDSSNTNYYTVESISLLLEYKLVCSILGFGVTYTRELKQNQGELLNGKWWIGINVNEKNI